MNLFRRTSRKWRGVDFMALKPRRNCGWVPNEDPAKVVVLQPRFGSGLLARVLQPRLKESKKFVRIPLEARGSWLWREMDGNRTVGQLVTGFLAAFPGDTEAAPERVATYLYQMAENSLIDFVNFKA